MKVKLGPVRPCRWTGGKYGPQLQTATRYVVSEVLNPSIQEMQEIRRFLQRETIKESV